MFRFIPILFVVISLISGCGSLAPLKHIKGSKPVSKSSPSKVTKSRATRLPAYTPSNNCSTILRDLSLPNATAIWCIPRGTK